jgi:hypothetical protein
MEKLFDFKNKLELYRWYRLVSLQTVIQYSVVYLLYMKKSIKWFQHPSTERNRAYYYSLEDRQLIKFTRNPLYNIK